MTQSLVVSDDLVRQIQLLAADRSETVDSVIRRSIALLLAHEHERGDDLDLAALVSTSEAFSWLSEEPDIYSLESGEAV